MAWSLSSEDRRFLQQVQSGRFPAAEFNHEAHLRLAYVHLAQHPAEVAVAQVAQDLQGLLAAAGAPPDKFHVTLTRAWVYAVWHFMQRLPDCECAADFIAASAVLQDAAIMETHFSHERLFSPAARTSIVQPDRDPIPGYAAGAR